MNFDGALAEAAEATEREAEWSSSHAMFINDNTSS
jgi:hypothetical protein